MEYAMENCTVLKRNVLVIYAARWINLKSFTWSVWLHLFDILEKRKLKWQITDQWLQRPGFSGLNAKECGDTMGSDGHSLYLDYGTGYRITEICQHPCTIYLKAMNFTLCKL